MNELTIPEYELLIEALELRQVDQEYWTHWQAFLNYAVKAERKVGKNRTKQNLYIRSLVNSLIMRDR